MCVCVCALAVYAVRVYVVCVCVCVCVCAVYAVRVRCMVYGAANEVVVMRRAVRHYNLSAINEHHLGDGTTFFCGMTPCRLVHI